MSLQEFLTRRFTTWVPPSPAVLGCTKRDVTLRLLPDQPFGVLGEHLLYRVVRKTKIPPWTIVYCGGKSIKTIDNLAPCNPHQFKVKIILKASAVHQLSNIFINKYKDEEAVYKYFDEIDKENQEIDNIEHKQDGGGDIVPNTELETKEEEENESIVDEKGDSEKESQTDINKDVKKYINKDVRPDNDHNDDGVKSKTKQQNRGEYVSAPQSRRWLESEWSAEAWCSTASDGTSAACFCMTVRGGYIKQVQMLLEERPALLEIINPNNGYTPLATAIMKGDTAMVKFLISCGADVDARSAGSHAPLHLAALAGHAALVDLLIDKGADITACDVNGLRVEHYAVASCSVEVLRRVLARGGHIEASDRHRWTPLFRAVIEGAPTQLLQELLCRGADVAATDCAGLTLPSLAANLTHNGRRRSSVLRLVDARYPQAAARAHYTRLTRKIHTIHTLTQH